MSWCIGKTYAVVVADHSFSNDIRYGAKRNTFIMRYVGKKLFLETLEKLEYFSSTNVSILLKFLK